MSTSASGNNEANTQDSSGQSASPGHHLDLRPVDCIFPPGVASRNAGNPEVKPRLRVGPARKNDHETGSDSLSFHPAFCSRGGCYTTAAELSRLTRQPF